jgi:hypothetical protein
VLALLEEREYPKHSDETSVDKKSYDYLTKTPVISLTKEKINELEKQTREKQSQLNNLRKTTNLQLWKNDLEQIQKHLDAL